MSRDIFSVYLLLVGIWYFLDTTSANKSNISDLSAEKRLIIDLITSYESITTIGRPVRNNSKPLRINFALGLIRMDVEEKENMLILSVWTKYKWRDDYLSWDPDEYGGVRKVTLPSGTIWMPDIMLYNTASTEKFEREVNVLVDYNGTVHWFPHRIFYSTCSIDVRDFPFDNQTCHLWFGSWTHKVHEVDLHLGIPTGIDLSTFRSDFKETSKWDITDVDASRMVDEMAVLTVTLYLQRRMIFSSYILTFPVIFMSFLTLLVFWLPADHADKSNLGMTIFGSLLLLLLILVEAAPPTSAAVPKLGIYYCFNIVIVMLSIFLSSLVTHIGGAGTAAKPRKPVPKWLKKIFRCEKGGCSSRPLKDLNHMNSIRGNGRAEEEMGHLLGVLKNVSSDNNQGTDKVCSVLQGYINQRKADETRVLEIQQINLDWCHVATVLDRIFLITYSLVITASLVWLFPR